MGITRIYELPARTVVNTDYLVVTPTGGPSGLADLKSVLIAGLNMPTRTTSGAGETITIKASNGYSSGAGGSIILQPGAQATTGGDGVVVFKQPAASTIADTLQFQNSTGTVIARINNAGAYICSPGNYTLSASQNNLALTNSSFQRVNCTIASSITGIGPATGTTHVDGRMMRLFNVGSANITLAHASASSDAANRMFSVTALDVVLAPNDYAELIYDGTNNGSGVAGWRLA